VAAISDARWVENNAGLKEYLNRDPDLYRALFASVKPAVEYSRSIAPVLTGEYRDSIRAEKAEHPPGLLFFSDDNKAHWIEYGAKNTKRQRVLGQGVDRITVNE